VTVAIPDALAAVQSACCERYLAVPAADRLQQYHPDLSPLAWHLGHVAFIETYWIREVVAGDDSATRGLHEFWFPESSPKHQRGVILEADGQLLDRVRGLFTGNRARLADLMDTNIGHELLKDGYLHRFLVQHHAQHVETMDMVLTQRRLAQDSSDYVVKDVLQPARPRAPERALDAATAWIGSSGNIDAFDNELECHQVELAAFRIAGRPVSNAEYLGFMIDGGYDNQELWSDAGWNWRKNESVNRPQHWRRDGRGHWYAITAGGPVPLAAADPVEGISYHEARACARWAGCRLPHETEWEHACSDPRFVASTGTVWEWCANPFYPYPGYRAFPYPRYSSTWFDGNHYSLRGGGRHTHPALKRPSFRNFYTPGKRHIFAGLRLAADA